MTRDDFFLVALDQAARGTGFVEPNPRVGAVIARGGTIVATGFHERFGGPHAEIVALERAGRAARGADLFLTLEPCVAFPEKKTPACAPRIAASGLRRVFVLSRDPHPCVAGRGIRALREAGIVTHVGGPAALHRRLNRPHFKIWGDELPYVVCKWAMTLDGKIASRTGDSKWITSAAAREIGRDWRERLGSVMVGSGTVLADNPRLQGVTRVLLDRRGRIPTDSAVLRTARRYRTLIGIGPGVSPRRFERAGAEVIEYPGSLRRLLMEVKKRGIRSLLVEGGGTLHASILNEGLADEVLAMVAPSILGGCRAITPVEGPGIARVNDALRLSILSVRVLKGGEFLVHAATRQP